MNKLMWKALEAGVGLKAHLLSLRNEKGQGTTEYAILVGVLAVIAMIAIAVFKEKISTLWEAISNGVNGL
jgi:Flp pilus assembly pilin Flp